MDFSEENQINLKTLQRVDSSIVEIIDNACQVAIYKYERKLKKWEETDIEGTLFLYKRALYPHHGFIIVNRMSTTNFVESITSDMQFQLQKPYLLYKNHSGDIIGSWFYEHKDLQRISERIQKIILKQIPASKRQRRASESETLPFKDKAQSQDILTLLSEAQEEYLKKSNNPDFQADSSKDINKLSTYLEKETLDKYVDSIKENHDNSVSLHSFDDNYPVSPRRRFMSTGSFDQSKVNYLSRMFSVKLAPSNFFNPEVRKDDVANDSCSTGNAFGPIESSSSRKVPSLLEDELSPSIFDTSSLKENLKHIPQYDVCDKKNLQHFSDQNWRTVFNNDSSIHFKSVKEAIKSHIQENPGVILKVHEAYVSSLKSLFV